MCCEKGPKEQHETQHEQHDGGGDDDADDGEKQSFQ